MNRLAIACVLALLLTFGNAQDRDKRTPKLAVLIVADHMNASHFDRYGDLFSGGFQYLAETGTVFTECYHDHAETATGPGHFVLGSGVHPGKAGIVGNNRYDRKMARTVYCIEDSKSTDLISGEPSVSFREIPVESVGDWVKKSSPASKVFSISGKDRSSVMMGGMHPDLAIWYNWAGKFTSSDYYSDELPAWLNKFNLEMDIQTYRDSVWTRVLSPQIYERYARRDDYRGEWDTFLSGDYSPVFPIGFNSTLSDGQVLSDIGGRPWLDILTIKVAENLVIHENLGTDSAPDILFLSLSALDWITHDYGPFSQEVLDALIRIDRSLGKFITLLEKEIGLDNILFVLSGDHGGMALPEYLEEFEGKQSGRFGSDDLNRALKLSEDKIYNKFKLDHIFARVGKGIYITDENVRENEVLRNKVADMVENEFLKIPGVYRIIRTWDLEENVKEIPFFDQYRNSYHPDNSPDIIILPRENWVYRFPYGTTHGTPWEYDRHVTTVFSGPGIKAGRDEKRVRTVDIAPTIARLLGFDLPPSIDGKVLNDSLLSKTF